MKTETKMSDLARKNLELAGSYSPDDIESDWADGEYGTLYCYTTGEEIRPATLEQAALSYEAGPEGAFPVDCRSDEELQKFSGGEDYVTCYVSPA